MQDVSEALERLAGLRDRGILTSEEFDRQKAALLDPPVPAAPYVATAPYVPAAPRAVDPTPLYILGGIALVGVIALILWATGVFGNSGSNAVVAGGATPFGATAPANPFGAAVPGAASGNPMIGEWVPDIANGECPAHVTITPTQVSAVMRNGRAESFSVTFTVQSADTVLMARSDRPGSGRAVTVRDGHMTLEECSFHRA